MKRIIICFDGTWNRIDAEEPTNVLMLATGIAPNTRDGISQIIHYDEGVGTTGGWAKRRLDGALGLGVLRNLSEAYRFLMFNYDPLDEVYVFGFSRGAFTARSFVGLVRNAGIIQRDHVREVKTAIDLYRKNLGFNSLDMLSFRAKYSRHISTCGEDEHHRCQLVEDYEPGSSLPFKFRYVGLWDTVESIGFGKVAWSAFRKRTSKAYVDRDFRFHDHMLSGIVAAGRHAVALDERRHHFHSEPWGDVEHYNKRLGFDANDLDRPIQEQFFPGDHGSVGGGGDVRGLSDGAFDWVVDGAKASGLELDASATSSVYRIFPDYQVSTRNTTKPQKKFSLMGRLQQDRSHKPNGLHQVHDSAQRRWVHGDKTGAPYRPPTLAHLTEILSKLMFDAPLEVKFDPERGKEEVETEGGAIRYYTIVKGDSLSVIAKEKFGSATHWKAIYELNKGIISNPDKIFVGQVIRLPLEIPDDDQ